MTDRQKGNLYILSAALLWSTGGALIRFVPWNSFVINSLRSLLALLLFVVLRRGFRVKINPTILLAAFCLAATTTLFVLANKLTTAANAIVLQYLAPIFVLAFSCVRDRKPPTLRQTLILLIAFAGTVLFFFDQLDTGHLLGNVLSIISGVTFAGVYFINSRPEASSDDSSMLGFLLAFLIGLPFYGAAEITPSVPAVLAILALGLLQVGLAYVVFGRGCKLTDPVTASLIGLIEAMLNPVWVLLVFGEKPGRWALAGAVMILAAIAANLLTGEKSAKTGA